MKRAALSAGLLLVAALAGCGASSSSAADPATSAASPTLSTPPATSVSPARSVPSASLAGSQQPVKAAALLDLRTVKVDSGARISVPAVPECPAAGIPFAFNDGHPEAAANGCHYSLYGQSAFSYGDLTGDGHAELIVMVDYRNPQSTAVGREWVVVGATGPSTYKTIASGPVLEPSRTQGFLVQAGKIIAYNSTYQYTPANKVGTYRLSGTKVLP